MAIRPIVPISRGCLKIQGRPACIVEPDATVLLYSDTTENTSSSSVAYTYNVSLGNYQYTLFQIDEKLSSTSGACDMWIEFNGKTGIWASHASDVWRFRSHNRYRYSHPIRCCVLNTATNPADWCNNLQSDAKTYTPLDSETCYYYKTSSTSTNPNSTTYVTHSLLIDNSTGIAKHYINGNYTCNGNLVTGNKFTGLAKVRETGMYYYYKNVYIYGSSNITDLERIIAGGSI